MRCKIIFLFFCCCSAAVAQNADSLTFEKVKDNQSTSSFDLLEVPVTEAVNSKVSVASKIEESNTEAPNSITVYTAHDIQRLGYYTLEDLASITSGYSVSYQYGEAGFETRGQTAGGFNNNKHLLLIDGIPVNFTRSYKAQIQEELPLMFAQRVEFLKGPASALYGVSAFSGVVNIVPKSIDNSSERFENKISVGTRDNNRRWMSNLMHRSKLVDVQLSTGYYEKEASGAYLTDPHQENDRYWDGNQSIFCYSSVTMRKGPLKGLKQGLIYMQRRGGLGESFANNYTSQVNRIQWGNLTPYLQYNKKLSDKLDLHSYLKFNNSTEDAAYQVNNTSNTLPNSSALSVYKSSVIDLEGLFEMKYSFSGKSSVISGLNYDWRREQGNPHSYAYNIKWNGQLGNPFDYPLSTDFSNASPGFSTASAFLQYKTELNVLQGLIVTTGLREDIGFNKLFSYTHLSPRVALVQKITNHLNLKLMGGRALRAPGIKEIGQNAQYINELGRNGFNNPGLFSVKAEAIQTLEMALVQTYRNLYISLTAYHNETRDEIITSNFTYLKDSVEIPGSWYTNRPGTIKAQGLEFDLKTKLSKQWLIFYNVAYAQSKDQSGMVLPNIPSFKTNLGVTFTNSIRVPFVLTGVVKHLSDYSDQINGKPYPPVWMVDMNLMVPLMNNFSAEIQVRNLLNDPSLLPSSGVPTATRNFLMTVAMKF
ncbi:MAG TPA: TonB-dependent receptor plug domain-containing protein [Cytophagaceae bacterium]|nr:TonB-dependent receptor plug domain-containing protein [Cytophagaceae bacterium]